MNMGRDSVALFTLFKDGSSVSSDSNVFKRSTSDTCRKRANLPPSGSKMGAMLSLNSSKIFIPTQKRKNPSAYFPQMKGYPGPSLNNFMNAKTAGYYNDERQQPLFKRRGCRPGSSSSFNSTNSSVDYTPYYDGRNQIIIPILQPYVRADSNLKIPQQLQSQIFEIQQIMRAKAEDGNLMIESSELLELVNGDIQTVNK